MSLRAWFHQYEFNNSGVLKLLNKLLFDIPRRPGQFCYCLSSVEIAEIIAEGFCDCIIINSIDLFLYTLS